MPTKIKIVFYNALFDFCGQLGQYYYHKSLEVEGEESKIRLKKKAWKCFDKREDILDILFAMKGLR